MKHLRRKSSHNFILFVFLLYIFISSIVAIIVGNELTSKTVTTQSKAQGFKGQIVGYAQECGGDTGNVCYRGLHCSGDNICEPDQGRCGLQGDCPAGTRCEGVGDYRYQSGLGYCRSTEPNPPQDWSGSCNKPGQSCCSEGDANYCNGGLICEGNVCVDKPVGNGQCANPDNNKCYSGRCQQTDRTCYKEYERNTGRCNDGDANWLWCGVWDLSETDPGSKNSGGGDKPYSNPGSGYSDAGYANPGQPYSNPGPQEPNPPELGPSLACHDLVPQRGHNHPCVGHLQVDLKDLHGYKLPKTSYFGAETEVAVKDLQGKNSLEQTGIVNRATWEKIHSFDKEPGPKPPQTGPQTSNDPKGVIDKKEGQKVVGWAFDPDEPSKSLEIHVYVYGNGRNAVGTSRSTTVNRPDVNSAHGITGTHGFDFEIPAPSSDWCDGKQYTADVFAINVGAGGNVVIGTSRWTCSPPKKDNTTDTKPDTKPNDKTIGKYCTAQNKGGTCQRTCSGTKLTPQSGCEGDPAEVGCCIVDDKTKPAGSCQPFSQEAPANRTVDPGSQTLSWPAQPDAVAYQLRIDDQTNPWLEPKNGKCDKVNDGDFCDDKLTSNSTQFTFKPNRTYDVWYHAINSCGEMSRAIHFNVTVRKEGGQDADKQNPTDSDIALSRVPDDVPQVCPGKAPGPNLRTERSIEPGNYMLNLPDLKTEVKYALIIDDISDGVLTKCSEARGADKCIENITPGDYGPVSFAAGKKYGIIYYAAEACGRTSNVSTIELLVGPQPPKE